MLQVYTGNGKGKTTAALGLALRALGAGLKVFIGQFAKGRECCELKALKEFDNVLVKQYGTCDFIKKKDPKGILLAKHGLADAKKVITKKRFDVIILDELNVALDLKLIKISDVLNLIKKIPKNKELIITGRCAHPGIVRIADLVSDIREVKHYYNKGISARRGIEY